MGKSMGTLPFSMAKSTISMDTSPFSMKKSFAFVSRSWFQAIRPSNTWPVAVSSWPSSRRHDRLVMMTPICYDLINYILFVVCVLNVFIYYVDIYAVIIKSPWFKLKFAWVSPCSQCHWAAKKTAGVHRLSESLSLLSISSKLIN